MNLNQGKDIMTPDLQKISSVIYYHLGHDNGEEKTEIELQREEERREKLKSIQDVLDKAEKIRPVLTGKANTPATVQMARGSECPEGIF